MLSSYLYRCQPLSRLPSSKPIEETKFKKMGMTEAEMRSRSKHMQNTIKGLDERESFFNGQNNKQQYVDYTNHIGLFKQLI